jgi:hypothetical protein
MAMGAGNGGKLNPTWVELLMGWPTDWTCIDNISHLFYLQWLMEVCYDNSIREKEALRVLRVGIVEKEISREIGRQCNIFEASILLSILCEYKERPDQARIFMACSKIFEEDLRELRSSAQITSTPYQSDNIRQQLKEYSDSLQIMPRLLAYFGKEAWCDGSWENAVPRTTLKTPARVDRLKCIGGGQVPAVAALAWRILNKGVNE